jgi:hypothetical protein
MQQTVLIFLKDAKDSAELFKDSTYWADLFKGIVQPFELGGETGLIPMIQSHKRRIKPFSAA